MFKVSDRVKVIHNSDGSDIVKNAMNQIGIVVRCNKGSMIYIEFGKVVWQTLTMIGFYENEIEPVSRKGEQLLFDFME